jgi:hypothetical protein
LMGGKVVGRGRISGALGRRRRLGEGAAALAAVCPPGTSNNSIVVS